MFSWEQSADIRLGIYRLMLGGAVGALVASQAIAQEYQIEEVIVSAEKRPGALQDTPISLTVITGEELRERQINDVVRLADQVPNVQLYDLSGGGVPVVVIRGVGLRNFRINDTPTTAVYVDDVYQPSIAQLQGALFDLERAEILKGPQGGLYGRNALGGAIQYVSARPELGESSGYAELAYGRYNARTAETAVNLPLGETTAVRIAGQVERSDDTYFRSAVGGFRHGEVDRRAIRAGLLWEPSADAEVYLKIHAGADRSDLPLSRVVPAYEPSGPSPVPGRSLSGHRGIFCTSLLAGGSPEPGRCTTIAGQTPASLGLTGRWDSASRMKPRLDLEWWGATAQASVRIGPFEVTSTTAYDRLDYRRVTDLDALPSVQQEIDYRTRIEAVSQTFRAAASPTEAVDILLGVDMASDLLRENTELLATEGILPVAFRATRFQQPYKQASRSWAGFGRIDYRASPSVEFAVEARYTEDQKSFVGGVFTPAFNSFVSPRSGELLFTDQDRTFSAWTGKLIAQYRPMDRVMVYASAARGFKTGGFFGGLVTTAAQFASYDNEYVSAFELGWKSEALDRRLRFNGALFYYDREGIQANGARPDASGLAIDRLTNIGDGQTVGVEADVLYAVTPDLMAGLSVGYVDSEITRSDVRTLSIFGGATNSPEGARLPNQPRFSANGYAQYGWSLPGGRLSARGDFAYQSSTDLEMAITQSEKNFLREDGYGLMDLSLRYEADAGWSLSATVENVTGVRYRVVARDVTSGGLYEIWGAPTTWRAVAGWRW